MSGGVLSFGGGGGPPIIPGTASAADIAAALALLTGDAGLRWVGTPGGDVQRAGTGRVLYLPDGTLASAALAALETLPDGSVVLVGDWLRLSRSGTTRAVLLDLAALGALGGVAADAALAPTGLESPTHSWSSAGLRLAGGGLHLTGLQHTGTRCTRAQLHVAAYLTGSPTDADFLGVGSGTTAASQLGGVSWLAASSAWRVSTRWGTHGSQTLTVTTNAGALGDESPMAAFINQTARGAGAGGANYGAEYGFIPGPATMGASTAFGPNLSGVADVAPVVWSERQQDLTRIVFVYGGLL